MPHVLVAGKLHPSGRDVLYARKQHGAIVVNTARGGLVDEKALVSALRSGRIGAAGLDVFSEEPLPGEHPLKQFDQVVLSPHIAGLTDAAAERMAVSSAQNIIDFFHGNIDPALVVNGREIHGDVQA